VDVQELALSYGPVGLLVICFISATIIPLASEAAVFGALKLGIPATEVLVYSSIGNCAAVAFNYWLGRLGSEAAHRNALKKKWAKSSLEYLEKHGLWALLLSWLPVIGDPLTIVGGIIRINFLHFALIVFSLRIARYVAILWIV
jgi:membrane protein YqaA with SNARE-associated domain